MLPVLLDKREDTCRYYTVGFAEVLVDFCREWSVVCELLYVVGSRYEPWRVRVMDCSSFSSSSVADKLRGPDVGRDMFLGGAGPRLGLDLGGEKLRRV